jgi:hypothetical protein
VADRAEVDLVRPNFEAAAFLLEQAAGHIASAGIEGVDPASAYILLYEGARKAIDAVLAAAGRRVTSGIGAHVKYLTEARSQLGSDHATLVARVDAARQIRHDVSYRSRSVTQSEIEGVRAAARETLEVARTRIAALSAS